MPQMAPLHLRFPLSEVRYWAERYSYAYDRALIDELVPEVRTQGFLTRLQLLTVVNWKAPRSRRHAEKAPEHMVIEATRIALSTTGCEELRIGVPSLIPGVGYPMASVLLHFFHADPYPIIDFRALWSLGIDRAPLYYTFRDRWAYVDACRRLSREASVDMRIFDRALWQYSKENQQDATEGA